MDTQRLILFSIFSFSLLLLWSAWQERYRPAPAVSSTQTPTHARSSPGVPPAQAPGLKAEASSSAQRIRVKTDLLDVEIDSIGGDLRRVALSRYRKEPSQSESLVLLDEKGEYPYYTQSGLIGTDLPTHKSAYQPRQLDYSMAAGANTLKVDLYWRGASGVRVTKSLTFRRASYVVDVAYEIVNESAHGIDAHAYFQLVRDGRAADKQSKLLPTYTGAAVYTDQDKFHKVSFEDIGKGRSDYIKQARDGWVAMLEHYFISAWLPVADTPREYFTRALGENLYSVGVIVPASVAAGGRVRVAVPLYVGPQEQERLEKVAPGLGLAVDYGWLTVIAAPLFWLLEFIHRGVGNWGVAIIFLTVLIKLAFFPLSAKSYKSMAQMRVLTPKMQKLKEQYGDDRQKMQQAVVELYKSENINPLGGCLPIVVQIPVFIALYWVLLASVEIRHAPFAAWIHDLSSPDPYYVLPVVMGATMLIQTRLNPPPPDPIQAKVMMIMPFAFSIFFFFFPAGLVLYWLVNNVLSIAQQWHITRQTEQSKSTKGNARA
ncbi:MAG: membrane protein insertase YidC [Burkholderiales bacterium]